MLVLRLRDLLYGIAQTYQALLILSSRKNPLHFPSVSFYFLSAKLSGCSEPQLSNSIQPLHSRLNWLNEVPLPPALAFPIPTWDLLHFEVVPDVDGIPTVLPVS